MTTKLEEWSHRRLNFQGSITRMETSMRNFRLGKGKFLTKQEKENLYEAECYLELILEDWPENQAKTRKTALRK